MPINYDRVADIRMEAARMLKEDGWCTGRFRAGPQRCLIAALSDATCKLEGTADDFGEAVHLTIAAASLAPKSHHHLMTWQDQPGRKLADVLAVLGS